MDAEFMQTEIFESIVILSSGHGDNRKRKRIAQKGEWEYVFPLTNMYSFSFNVNA